MSESADNLCCLPVPHKEQSMFTDEPVHGGQLSNFSVLCWKDWCEQLCRGGKETVSIPHYPWKCFPGMRCRRFPACALIEPSGTTAKARCGCGPTGYLISLVCQINALQKRHGWRWFCSSFVNRFF